MPRTLGPEITRAFEVKMGGPQERVYVTACKKLEMGHFKRPGTIPEVMAKKR